MVDKTHSAFDQSVNHPMDGLGLSKQTLLDSHHPQLPAHDRLASCRGSGHAVLADALLDAVAFLLDGLGIAHVAIGLCLHPDRIVFEVLVCPNARFEVDCIVL